HRRWGCRPVDHVQGGQAHAEQFGVVLGCPRHQLSVTTYTTSEPEAMTVTSCASPLSWTSRPASALTLWSTCRPASVSRSWACPPESSAETSTTDFTTPSELVLVAPRVGPSTIGTAAVAKSSGTPSVRSRPVGAASMACSTTSPACSLIWLQELSISSAARAARSGRSRIRASRLGERRIGRCMAPGYGRGRRGGAASPVRSAFSGSGASGPPSHPSQPAPAARSAQAQGGPLDRGAGVHHHLQARRGRAQRRRVVDHAELQPYGPGPDRDRFVHHVPGQ